MRLDQQRRECSALPFAAADRERAERDAVIALPARDEMSALRLAALDEILPRQLQRRLDRLRAAADKEDVAEAGGACATRSSASSSAACVVKKLVCA